MTQETASASAAAIAGPRYPLGEEIANSVTHGIGAALSIAATAVLVLLAGQYGDAWQVASFTIYGASLILLYLASTLYHAFPWAEVKKWFRLLDHSAIYLLIAGTYTPPLLIAMRGPWGWTLFGLIWGMAAFGLIFKIAFIGRYPYVSLGLYVMMGWLAIIAIKPMLAMLPPGLFFWLLLGGFFYTFGVLFYACKKIPYHHAIWHIFVLLGSAAHFTGMLLHLTAL